MGSTQSYSPDLGQISQEQLVTVKPRQLTILQLLAREEDFYSEMESTSFSSTGIFLYENGMAGTLQHLDLAVGKLA